MITRCTSLIYTGITIGTLSALSLNALPLASYPSQSIKFIVALLAGGSVDMIALARRPSFCMCPTEVAHWRSTTRLQAWWSDVCDVRSRASYQGRHAQCPRRDEPPTRLPVFPQVPTMQDAGVADLTLSAWMALLASAKTPRSIIDQLNKAVAAAFNAETRAKLAESGIEVATCSPEDVQRLIARDIKLHAELVKAAGLVPQ